MSFRNLRPFTLGTDAVDMRAYIGYGYLYLMRGAATGNLALQLDGSDDGTTWTELTAPVAPDSADLTGGAVTYEVNFDGLPRYIRKNTATVGDTVAGVGKIDGYPAAS